MKNLLTNLIFLMLALPGLAKSIDDTDARTIALDWMSMISKRNYYSTEINSVISKSDQGQVLFYVVSFSPQGWVMISGTDDIDPVIGFSQTSKFDLDNGPIQLTSWIDGTIRQIKRTMEPDYVPSRKVKEKWVQFESNSGFDKSAMAAVSPMLATAWDQGRYYNELCPADVTSQSGNGHVWAGCVATAMAQLMKFWNYPETGMASSSYIHAKYGMQTANFGETTYDWAAMTNSLSGPNSEVQKITYHSAVAVSMNFSPTSSGANITDAADAFEKYFKYSTSLFWTHRDYWGDVEEWRNLLRTEVDRGRPVLYSGFNAQKSVGHAFILDGYKGDYFHFNFGWGGNADGYYLIDLLNPSAQSFSYNQSVITSIFPVVTSNVNYPFIEDFEESETSTTITGVSDVVAAAAHTGNFGLQLGKPGFSSPTDNTTTFTFKVPANATLSFWVKRNSVAGKYNNNQSAKLFTQYNETEIYQFFNGDYTDANWVQYSLKLDAYAGEVLTLIIDQFLGYFAHSQYMYVDDISIVSGSQNLPPYVPSIPTPANNSTSLAITTPLNWIGGDPNNDSVSYQVYLSKSNNSSDRIDSTSSLTTKATLEYNTKYYWKVVASDGQSTVSSPVWNFTTIGIVPSISTCGVSEITQNTALVCGNIEATNNATILQKGICWGLDVVPSLAGKFVKNTTSDNPFFGLIDGLLPFTTYYARSYVVSNKGAAYGNIISFSSGAGLPVVLAKDVTSITKYSARVSVAIEALKDTAYVERGVVWSLSSGFDIDLAERISETGHWQDGDKFDVLVDGLPGIGTYFYRAFVRNSAGVAYSEEKSFRTSNASPVVNLDQDESTANGSLNYGGIVPEQVVGVPIADQDAIVVDPDGDSIVSLSFVLKQGSDDDYLICLSQYSQLNITGNQTHKVFVASSSFVADSVWLDVLRNTHLVNSNDAPDTSIIREVEITVSDGEAESAVAHSFLKIEGVNDAPVNLILPEIVGVSQIGSDVEVQKGTWIDSLDQCSLLPELGYTWELKDSLSVPDELVSLIENENQPKLNVDFRFCGKWIRAVEHAVDQNCGGKNRVEAQVATAWVKVQKKYQEIGILNDTVMKYQYDPIQLQAVASSGLPISFVSSNLDVLEIVENQLKLKGIGVVTLQMIQEGDACYLPASKGAFNINVIKGSPVIISNISEPIQYEDKLIESAASSSTEVGLEYSSLTPDVVSVSADHLLILGAGAATVLVIHPETELWKADTLRLNFNILKSEQALTILMPDTLVASKLKGKIEIQTTSGLPLSFVSSNLSVAQVEGDSLIFKQQGEFVLNISQVGNSNYWPIEDSKLFTVQWPVSVTDFGLSSILIYPNPAISFFNIVMNQEIVSDAELNLFSIDGKLILRQSIDNRVECISTQGIPFGVYMIQIRNGQFIHQSKLILISDSQR